jgi:hypothetical protein
MALALATSAAAQTAYRNVFPDGRVVYSDQPLPGAQADRPIAPPPPTQDLGSAEPRATAPAAAPAPAETQAAPAETAPAATDAPVAAVPGARWPPPPDAAQPSPAETPAPAPEPAAMPVAARMDSATPSDRIGTLATATEDLRAAERHLAATKATLEAGREALPGERTGLAHGGSRLNATYRDRQRLLETAVADAQARLDRAVADHKAARF